MNTTLYPTEVQNLIFEIQICRGKIPKRLIECCDKVEAYGNQIHDDALIAYAAFSRAETYYLLNDMRNFYVQMMTALPLMEKIEEWGYVVVGNNMLGIFSLNRGTAPFAMDYYMKAIGYCEKYHLPDLEWIVHMNIASLYLSIEESEKALDHLNSGLYYVTSHVGMEGYYQHLMTIYLGMGKAYLLEAKNLAHRDLLESAQAYNRRIETECKKHIGEIDLLVLSCFRARLANKMEDTAELRKQITNVKTYLTEEIPIMDIYDDLYDYMNLLVDIREWEEFIRVYKIVEALTSKTSVTNMQKRLLTLLIRYYRATDKEEMLREATLQYYDLSEQMEKENRLMVRNMITMRSTFQNLAQIHKEVEEENQALHRKSETDALTGLWNRFKLNAYGEEAYERAYHNKTPLAVEILDIDYFKQYNDNYGHQAGDEVLVMVAKKMQELMAYGNVFCARYGGDEFVIVYENISEEEARKMGERLQKSVCAEAREHKFSPAADVVTISQGICWGIPHNNNKMWDYLHTADECLYDVKKKSRNNFDLTVLKHSGSDD